MSNAKSNKGRIDISDVFVDEGHARLLSGAECEGVTVIDRVVAVIDREGRKWFHNQVFPTHFVDEDGFYVPDTSSPVDARNLAERVEVCGSIDPRHWSRAPSYVSDDFDDYLG